MVRGASFQAAGFALSLALTSAACHDKATQGGDGTNHHSIDGLTAEQAARVLAKVGDTTITLGDFAAALEHMDQFDRLRYQSPERRKELLNEMINSRLLAQEARDKGYDKDPRTQEELRSVLRDAMLKDARKGAPLPADLPADQVHAYYDAHRAEFRDPERRRVSVIVTATLPAAQAVLDQAKKGLSAAAWGALVRSKSIDPSAKVNVPVDLAGDLGMITPPTADAPITVGGDTQPGGALAGLAPRQDPSRVPEGVRVAAFAIGKVGDVAPDVVPAYGKFYVVRLTVKNDAQDRSYQEAERSIRVKLSQEKLRSREEDMLAALKAKFPVQIDDATMATVNVDVPDGGFGPLGLGGDSGIGDAGADAF
jgi:DNA-directed RNA polymerase subunit F